MPVKLSLGRDQSLDIFVDGYLKTQPIDCDSTDPVSPNPLKVVSCQAQTFRLCQGLGKSVSALSLPLKPLFIFLTLFIVVTINDKVKI
jgi:hypothetical protein